ncbi:MAG: SPOR domain-containing protein [Oligoflexus sp.]
MKLPAKTLGAAILGLSLIPLAGVWLLRQSAENRPISAARMPDTPLTPYFYQEIGTSRPQKNTVPGASVAPVRQYTIELGIVQDRARAEQAVRSLHDKGVEAFFTPINRRGQVIYRIRTGIFPQQEQAQTEANRLQTQLRLESRVNVF